MAVKDLTPKQLENAMRYGVCRVCKAPREIKVGYRNGRDGFVTSRTLVCPNGHKQ